jgi:hypothetical protein
VNGNLGAPVRWDQCLDPCIEGDEAPAMPERQAEQVGVGHWQ